MLVPYGYLDGNYVALNNGNYVTITGNYTMNLNKTISYNTSTSITSSG